MIDERGAPIVGDAFGAALLAALEQGESRAVIERDDGFVAVDEIGANYFGLPETWAERCRWALDRAGGRVLDVGAGAGRAALALQDRGQDVVALDTSAGALEVCERRGVRQQFLGTVDDLASAGAQPFDTFLALGNNLGFLENRELATAWFDLLWCSVDELAQLCEPAGWTIADVFSGTLYGVVLTAR